MEDSEIQYKSFAELNTNELYDLLALRTDIFVVEQNCVYPELDYHDQASVHLMLYNQRELRAYARLVPPGGVYELASIGRIAVRANFRRHGFGRKIFEASLKHMSRLYPGSAIKLQAQTYLEAFYGAYGFETISKPYPDFGVMHVDMIKRA